MIAATARSADDARAQAAREVQRVVERPEVDLRAVAVACGLDADLGAERAAEGVGDAADRLGLVGVQAARLALAGDARTLRGRPGAVLEHADRPALRRGLARQRAAHGVVGGEQQRAAVTFAEAAFL